MDTRVGDFGYASATDTRVGTNTRIGNGIETHRHRWIAETISTRSGHGVDVESVERVINLESRHTQELDTRLSSLSINLISSPAWQAKSERGLLSPFLKGDDDNAVHAD